MRNWKSSPLLPLSRTRRGMTLTEVIVAAGASTVIFGVLITASIQLQRNFASHQDYSKGLSNQTLVSNYLAMDLRRAKAVTALGENALTLQIPDYTPADGTQRRDPTIALITRANSRSLEAYYGANADSVVQVRYYKSGDVIFREEGTRGSIAIADHVSFEADYPLIDDPDNAGTQIQDKRRVSLSIQFTPRRKRKGLSDADQQTYIFNTVTLRNNG